MQEEGRKGKGGQAIARSQVDAAGTWTQLLEGSPIERLRRAMKAPAMTELPSLGSAILDKEVFGPTLSKSPYNWERLEFIGDQELNAVVARVCFVLAPMASDSSPIGTWILTHFQLLSSNEFASELAVRYRLSEKIGGPVPLAHRSGADRFEAYIGALAISKGSNAVNDFLAPIFYSKIMDMYANTLDVLPSLILPSPTPVATKTPIIVKPFPQLVPKPVVKSAPPKSTPIKVATAAVPKAKPKPAPVTLPPVVSLPVSTLSTIPIPLNLPPPVILIPIPIQRTFPLHFKDLATANLNFERTLVEGGLIRYLIKKGKAVVLSSPTFPRISVSIGTPGKSNIGEKKREELAMTHLIAEACCNRALVILGPKPDEVTAQRLSSLPVQTAFPLIFENLNNAEQDFEATLERGGLLKHLRVGLSSMTLGANSESITIGKVQSRSRLASIRMLLDLASKFPRIVQFTHPIVAKAVEMSRTAATKPAAISPTASVGVKVAVKEEEVCVVTPEKNVETSKEKSVQISQKVNNVEILQKDNTEETPHATFLRTTPWTNFTQRHTNFNKKLPLVVDLEPDFNESGIGILELSRAAESGLTVESATIREDMTAAEKESENLLKTFHSQFMRSMVKEDDIEVNDVQGSSDSGTKSEENEAGPAIIRAFVETEETAELETREEDVTPMEETVEGKTLAEIEEEMVDPTSNGMVSEMDGLMTICDDMAANEERSESVVLVDETVDSLAIAQEAETVTSEDELSTTELSTRLPNLDDVPAFDTSVSLLPLDTVLPTVELDSATSEAPPIEPFPTFEDAISPSSPSTTPISSEFNTFFTKVAPPKVILPSATKFDQLASSILSIYSRGVTRRGSVKTNAED